MAIFKCKMCGGTLNFTEGSTVAECECCGTKQTLPKLSDEKRTNLYDRANHFRRNNDYDKALSIYEQILNEDKTDAEAYWSIVLCKYGIEYVEDPTTHKRVPTINRTQFTSIFADEDYKSAMAYADGYQRDLYEAEAKEIDKIQKGILAISDKESPYDVFICYKETDNGGRRTQDSVLAQDLYFGLKNEGFNVFFSRITLEDKLGSAYEPHIFAAIHSAKVMVVLGTKAEHFNAVWVKNEWSRYLALIKKGENKTLIPAYKDMDPYDLPDEFSHLQAQDMSKLGFMQDLLRGIKKIVEADREKSGQVKETVVVSGKQDITPLLKRAFLFIEDGDFSSANDYAEKVLDINPECSEAYIVKALIDLQLCKIEQLSTSNTLISNNSNFKKAIRFFSGESHSSLLSYQEANEKRIRELNEIKRKETIYNNAIGRVKNSPDDIAYKKSISELESIIDYKDAREQVQRIRRLLEKWVIYKEGQKRKEEEMAFFLREQKRYDEQKKKKEKKTLIIFFSVLIAVIAVITVILIPVINRISDEKAAQEAAEQAADLQARNGLILKEKEDYYIVTGVEEFNEHIIIPSTYKGKEIKEVSSNAFSNTDIKSVVVPNSICSIGLAAFSGCSNLEKITLPFIGGGDVDVAVNSGIEPNIFGYIFGTNKFSGGIISGGRGETSSVCYYIPATLETVVITGGDVSIGAFANCENITSITLPENITTIADYSFYNCKKLQEINITDTVESIGEEAFYNCINIENVYIDDVANWCGISFADYYSNPLYYAENFYLNEVPVTNLTIPNGVVSISDFAFYNYLDLISVTIPSSLTSIGNSAFYGCYKLIEVRNLSETISLTRGFPDNGFIANYAKSIHTTEQSNITTVDEFIIYCDSNKNENYLIGYIGNDTRVVLPNTISNNSYGLYDYAFYHNNKIREVIFSNNINSIGISTFEGCTFLSDPVVPNSVTSINTNAFKDCVNFNEIVIPNSVSYLGEGVLSGCSSLESVTLPFIGSVANPTEQSKATVFGYIFGQYNYTGAIATSQSYASSGNVIQGVTYYIPTKLKKATITGGKVLYGAFSECVMLTTIILPNCITSIGEAAFEKCLGLTTITIPASVKYIEKQAFIQCTNLVEVKFSEGLISIGLQAFGYCSSLEKISIPDSVTSLGRAVFFYCTALSNVHLGKGLESIGDSAFYYCDLVTITIPSSVTTIGSGVFTGCNGLKGIAFEDVTTWYKTNNFDDWTNKTGGTEIDLSVPETNITYFNSVSYFNNYWYKL